MLEVLAEGEPVELRGAKVRALLAMLALHPGEVLSADRLVEGLWAESPPPSAANTLQGYVSQLRRILGPGTIVTRPPGYVFASSPEAVDAGRFERLVDRGRAALRSDRVPEAAELLSEGLKLWRGPALSEFAYESFAQAEAVRLEELRLAATEELAEARLALGDHVALVGELQALVNDHPLRERLWGQLILALYRCGRQAESLRAYALLRRRLGEELGIAPSPALQRLEEAVLAQTPALEWRAAAAAPAPSAETHHNLPRPRARADQSPFIGRTRELESVLETIGSGEMAVFVVSGPPGTGKSRFLAEVTKRADVPVVSACALSSHRHEPWSLARSLVRAAVASMPEAADALPRWSVDALWEILPDIGDPPVVAYAMDPQARRALTLDAAAHLVAAGAGGGLVIVDNLQWVDSTSLQLLALVVARAPAVTLLVASRTEKEHDAEVSAFLDDLAGALSPVDLPLGALSVEEIAGLPVDREVAALICEETDATPATVSAVLGELTERGLVTRGDGRCHADTTSLKEAVREATRASRYRSLRRLVVRQAPRRQELLQLVVLAQGEVPTRVLAAAQSSDPMTTLDHLEALAGVGLVHLGDGGWRPQDEVVVAVATEALEVGTRARLHHALAAALVDADADSAEVAHHLACAGDKHAAAAKYAEAARRRLAGYAAGEAAQLVEQALKLQPTEVVRRDLLRARATARELLGDRDGARGDFRVVADALPPGPDRARVLAKIALLMVNTDPKEADEIIDVASTEASSDDRARAETLATGAIIDININRLDRAEERCARALGLFEALGDQCGVASVLDARSTKLLFEGHIRDAAEKLDRVARLYRDAGSLLKVGTPRSLCGWALMLSGRPERGLVHVDQALELERALGQLEGEALCLWVKAEVLAALGRGAEATAIGEQAVALNRRNGDREGIVMSLCAQALAIARQGDLDSAARLLEEAMAGGEGLATRSVATGRLAALWMVRGDAGHAERYARLSLAEGPPLAHFEGRLVLAELALQKHQPDARPEAQELLAEVTREGYVSSTARARLQALIGT